MKLDLLLAALGGLPSTQNEIAYLVHPETWELLKQRAEQVPGMVPALASITVKISERAEPGTIRRVPKDWVTLYDGPLHRLPKSL